MGLDYLHKDVEQLYIYYITIYDKACRFMELRYYDVLADNYGWSSFLYIKQRYKRKNNWKNFEPIMEFRVVFRVINIFVSLLK